MKNQIRDFLELPVDPDMLWQGGTFPFGSILPSDFAADLRSQSNEDCFANDAEAKGALDVTQVSMALWAAPNEEKTHAIPDKSATPFEILVRTLCEFADVQGIGYRPARLEVTDENHANELRRALGDCGTEVVYEPNAEFWYVVRDTMTKELAGLTQKFPPLASSDCSEEAIRQYAFAAAAFYRSRIWRHLNDEDVLKLHGRGVPKPLRFATILGSGRQEYGIGFYESPDIHWDMYAQRADPRDLEIASVTFSNIDEVDPADVAMWEELELPLETGEAFPVFLFYSQGGARLPAEKELKFATRIILALADTSEDEIDTGKWKKSIQIDGKAVQQTLSIPDLLDPPDRQTWMQRGLLPDPRANERFHGLISSFMSQNEFDGIEEANEAIAKKFSGSFDDFDYPDETSQDKAKNVYFEAIDNYGRRQIQLARKALEIDPNHIGANNLWAESEFDLDARIERFRRSVELGTSELSELLNDTESIGHFWGISETRPFMRAKFGLAKSLQADGQANEAVSEMLDILRLNENDNLGVRNEIVPLLLGQNRESEAVEILNRYPEESASWLYLNAQVKFRAGGPRDRNAINAAFRMNPHVVELLLSPDPPLIPQHYAFGSPEEAAIVIQEQLDSWTETENFVPWMIESFERFERESAKRERSRRLKLQKKKRKNKAKRKKTRK